MAVARPMPVEQPVMRTAVEGEEDEDISLSPGGSAAGRIRLEAARFKTIGQTLGAEE